MNRRNFVHASVLTSIYVGTTSFGKLKYTEVFNESDLKLMKCVEEQLTGKHLQVSMSKRYISGTLFFPKKKIESVNGRKLVFTNRNSDKIVIEKKEDHYILRVFNS